mmetsp:Transcript_11415/g.39835  ORF Transcript_11415/g.39835 Transcript_11415/m.39835 type:complete len:206 (+) Transcript_11415:919-1536(+)
MSSAASARYSVACVSVLAWLANDARLARRSSLALRPAPAAPSLWLAFLDRDTRPPASTLASVGLAPPSALPSALLPASSSTSTSSRLPARPRGGCDSWPARLRRDSLRLSAALPVPLAATLPAALPDTLLARDAWLRLLVRRDDRSRAPRRERRSRLLSRVSPALASWPALGDSGTVGDVTDAAAPPRGLAPPLAFENRDDLRRL